MPEQNQYTMLAIEADSQLGADGTFSINGNFNKTGKVFVLVPFQPAGGKALKPVKQVETEVDDEDDEDDEDEEFQASAKKKTTRKKKSSKKKSSAPSSSPKKAPAKGTKKKKKKLFERSY